MFYEDDEEWIQLVDMKSANEEQQSEDSVEVIEAPKMEQIEEGLDSEKVIESSEKYQKNQEDKKQKIEFLVHKLCFGDTLEGLQLQYNVSAQSIKARNNLNSNDIYYLKEIIIPFPKANYEIVSIDTEAQEKLRKDYIVKGFINQLSPEDKSSKLAIYYLQQTAWDIYEAVKAYNSDREWERQNPTLQPKKYYFNISNLTRSNPYLKEQFPEKKIK